MNEFETYEYVIAAKKTGKARLFSGFLILAYILFAVGMLLLAVVSRLGAPMVALTPFGLALLIFLTWRYTKVEYEMSFTSGEVTVSKIYGGRSRREMVTFRLRDCTLIAPMSNRLNVEKAELFKPDVSYDARSSEDAEDAYVVTFESEDGKKGLVCFEATQKALRICHFYNASATTLSKVSR